MRIFGWMLAVSAVALLGACGEKGGEAPADPALVTAASEPAKSEGAAPTAATATSEEAHHAAAGADMAGCAAHEAKAGSEADCPFPEEKAAAAAADEGCAENLAEAAEAKTTDGGALHLGGAFALTEAKPLGSLFEGAQLADGQELSVRVSGKIDKVCQKKGCWMVVRDGDVEARVIMKDHAFAVPRDASGKAAQVEGTLKVRLFTEAQAKHLAEDGGEDPTKVSGEKKELLLTATAVEIGG